MNCSLICLPFAGSGAGFYRAWQRLGDSDVQVVPLQLPGREERFLDPPYEDIALAVKEIATDIGNLPLADGPIALFGHSLGAILAYEAMRELANRGLVVPKHLFVSGSPGPLAARAQRATGLDDDEFLARVTEFAGYRHEAFDDPDLRELLLPLLRADVAMHEDYRPAAVDPLDVPITALRGRDDQLVSSADIEKWRAATSGPFDSVEVPGGHMYLVDSARSVLALAARTLRDSPDGK